MKTVLYLLGAILVIFWLIGLLLNIVGALIHLALLLGIILFIVAWVRGRRRKDQSPYH
jgi:hypothetical protein